MIRSKMKAVLGVCAIALFAAISAAPASASPIPAPSAQEVVSMKAVNAASPPYGTLQCGYNVGFGGSGRWYRNCTNHEVNVGAFVFQGLWCVRANSYRELSAFTVGVQIVSNDCSNPKTDH
jgi:hypothetical protein